MVINFINNHKNLKILEIVLNGLLKLLHLYQSDSNLSNVRTLISDNNSNNKRIKHIWRLDNIYIHNELYNC